MKNEKLIIAALAGIITSAVPGAAFAEEGKEANGCSGNSCNSEDANSCSGNSCEGKDAEGTGDDEESNSCSGNSCEGH